MKKNYQKLWTLLLVIICTLTLIPADLTTATTTVAADVGVNDTSSATINNPNTESVVATDVGTTSTLATLDAGVTLIDQVASVSTSVLAVTQDTISLTVDSSIMKDSVDTTETPPLVIEDLLIADIDDGVKKGVLPNSAASAPDLFPSGLHTLNQAVDQTLATGIDSPDSTVTTNIAILCSC